MYSGTLGLLHYSPRRWVCTDILWYPWNIRILDLAFFLSIETPIILIVFIRTSTMPCFMRKQFGNDYWLTLWPPFVFTIVIIIIIYRCHQWRWSWRWRWWSRWSGWWSSSWWTSHWANKEAGCNQLPPNDDFFIIIIIIMIMIIIVIIVIIIIMIMNKPLSK